MSRADQMTTILLVRHGETAWNRRRIFRGTRNVPLNENGRAQADLLGERLRSRRIDAAYSSPLGRALETAERALGCGELAIATEPRLIDFDYGDWTGIEEAEVSRRWPELFFAWDASPESVRPPGGDTLGEVADRAFECMEELAASNPSRTIALFAHRVVNKLLMLKALGLGVERFAFIRQDNVSLNELQRTHAGYVICSVNDTSHLRGDGVELLKEDF
jgi:broad specificity phosphatase PhoE